MESSELMGFNLPSGSDGFTPVPLSDNWRKLDGIPLPCECGKTGIWTWKRYSDGTYEMWGNRSDPAVTCTIAMAQRWRSGELTQSLPISIRTIDFMVPHAVNNGSLTLGTIHVETQAMITAYDTGSIRFFYATDQDEQPYSGSNKWPKTCYFLLKGTW